MIRLDGVTKKFDHRGLAGVSALDFEASPGEIIAILGPNGSGKSTLLNLIGKRIQPDFGLVHAPECHFFELKAHLPDRNVQEFLISKVKKDIDAEKKVQLARDLADIFEFTFQLRQNLSQLSAGQHQKVMMASELMDRPEVILMDEPFAHLDPFTRGDILRSFFTYIKNQGSTVLWVTHDLDEAYRYADRLSLMNFGKIVQSATPETVLFQPRSLFVAQFLGYKNFCTIKRQGPHWQTPWGAWTNESSLKGDEAIMVIPTMSWIIGEGSPARLSSRTLKSQGLEIEFVQENQTYWLQTTANLASLPEKFTCRARLEDCFLVPL